MTARYQSSRAGRLSLENTTGAERGDLWGGEDGMGVTSLLHSPTQTLLEQFSRPSGSEVLITGISGEEEGPDQFLEVQAQDDLLRQFMGIILEGRIEGELDHLP